MAATIPGHEVVGERLVGRLPSQAMVAVWVRATSRIVKYGFVVEYRDLEAPRTGVFDGLAITLDPDVDFERRSKGTSSVPSLVSTQS